MTKRALQLYGDLPPGTFLRRLVKGPLLVKCAAQWDAHHVSEEHVFNALTGTLHHVSEYLPAEISAEQFLVQWKIDLPSSTSDELEILARARHVIAGHSPQKNASEER